MAYTNAATIVRRGLPRHRGPRRAVLRLRPARPAPTTRRRWQYEGRRAAAAGRRASRTSRHAARARPPARRQHETRRPERRRARPSRRGRDAAAPALRLPDPQAALRPLHAGDGRSEVCGIPPEPFLEVVRGGRPRNSGRERTTALRLRGRLDPAHASACSTSAPRRSCSCCSATSAAPAAASWRCAGTPASRARPTSRRCSTCCPATCRCPTRGEHDTSRTTSTASPAPSTKGFWAQRRRLRRQPAQGLLGRRGHRGQRLLLRLPAAADRRPRHLPDRRWT